VRLPRLHVTPPGYRSASLLLHAGVKCTRILSDKDSVLYWAMGSKGRGLAGETSRETAAQMWVSSLCSYWIPGTDLRLAVLCKSISSITGLSAFFGSSRSGIRSTMSLTKGTAAMCGAFSERLE
jgi:hypothetical protein